MVVLADPAVIDGEIGAEELVLEAPPGEFDLYAGAGSIILDNAPEILRASERQDLARVGDLEIINNHLIIADASRVSVVQEAVGSPYFFATRFPVADLMVWVEEKYDPSDTPHPSDDEEDDWFDSFHRILCVGPAVHLFLHGPMATEIHYLEMQAAHVLRLKGRPKQQGIEELRDRICELFESGIRDDRLESLAKTLKIGFGPSVQTFATGPHADQIQALETRYARMRRLKGADKADEIERLRNETRSLLEAGVRSQRLDAFADLIKLKHRPPQEKVLSTIIGAVWLSPVVTTISIRGLQAMAGLCLDRYCRSREFADPRITELVEHFTACLTAGDLGAWKAQQPELFSLSHDEPYPPDLEAELQKKGVFPDSFRKMVTYAVKVGRSEEDGRPEYERALDAAQSLLLMIEERSTPAPWPEPLADALPCPTIKASAWGQALSPREAENLLREADRPRKLKG